jgi:hypothetical protein
MLSRGYELELNCRIAVFLLSIHSSQIIATSELMEELIQLKTLLLKNLQSYRNLIGTNKMGFLLMQRMMIEKEESVLPSFGAIEAENQASKKRKIVES